MTALVSKLTNTEFILECEEDKGRHLYLGNNNFSRHMRVFSTKDLRLNYELGN